MSVATSVPAADPYAPKLTLWQRYPHLGWGLAVCALTTLFTYVAFPPVNIGEAGYVLLVPAVLWAYRKPRFRPYAFATLGGSVLGWTLLLSWLSNVSWLGLLLLGPLIGLLYGAWFLVAWWWIPRVRGHRVLVRLLALLGLAGLFVLGEWVRGWIFGGFPWLPLAASQWQRPIISARKGNDENTSSISAAMNSGLRLRRPVAPSKKMRCA